MSYWVYYEHITMSILIWVFKPKIMPIKKNWRMANSFTQPKRNWNSAAFCWLIVKLSLVPFYDCTLLRRELLKCEIVIWKLCSFTADLQSVMITAIISHANLFQNACGTFDVVTTSNNDMSWIGTIRLSKPLNALTKSSYNLTLQASVSMNLYIQSIFHWLIKIAKRVVTP